MEYRGEHLGSSGGIRLDTTILPSPSTYEDRHLTISIRPPSVVNLPSSSTSPKIASGEDIVVGYRVVSEVSPGEVVESAVSKVVEPTFVSKAIAEKLGWKSE